MGAKTAKGLNGIAKIGCGHLYLREENFHVLLNAQLDHYKREANVKFVNPYGASTSHDILEMDSRCRYRKKCGRVVGPTED